MHRIEVAPHCDEDSTAIDVVHTSLLTSSNQQKNKGIELCTFRAVEH